MLISEWCLLIVGILFVITFAALAIVSFELSIAKSDIKDYELKEKQRKCEELQKQFERELRKLIKEEIENDRESM